MAYTVYMHITPSNKRYIGITCRKPEYRWNNGKGYSQNNHFYNAILKYGWDNIEHIIVADELSKETACEMEKLLIKEYKTTDPDNGYNHSTGGDGGSAGVVFTEERKQKLRIASTGRTHTEQAKKKMSEGHKGKPSWNKGRAWTESEKKKLQIAQTGNKPVRCIETGVTYYSAREASRETGISRCSIKDCCNGRTHCKSAGGFHWEFI